MGKFDFHFDVKLTQQLERLKNFDEIAETMLIEATPILLRHVKGEVAKHKRTGDLLASIQQQRKPTKNDRGWFMSVLPTGKDRKGVSNMAKLVYLEYGTKSIRPKPILTKALNDAREEVNEKMMEVMERYTK